MTERQNFDHFLEDTYPPGEPFFLSMVKDLRSDSRKGLDIVTRPLRRRLQSTKDVINEILRAISDFPTFH